MFCSVFVQMKGDYGYLPANIWPQYPVSTIHSSVLECTSILYPKFSSIQITESLHWHAIIGNVHVRLFQYFSIMSVAYLLVGTIWILLWARAHQHSAKIHLVIGALAAAGNNLWVFLSNSSNFIFINFIDLFGFGSLRILGCHGNELTNQILHRVILGSAANTLQFIDLSSINANGMSGE